MIIPISKSPAGLPPQQGGPLPSQTNLLMALATMHKAGRFVPKPTPEEPTNG